MKKLLQINVVVNSGSTGRIAEEIGQLAISKGWESYIAFGRNERQSKSKPIKIGSDFNIKLHALQTRIFDQHGLGSRLATIKFISQIKELKPDIIHLHNIHGYYLNIEILFNYLSKSNIPVIWTLHDCWPITGHCTNFSFAGCNKWKTECCKCPQKKEYPGSYVFDRSKQNFYLKKSLFCSLGNMVIVPVSNWLDNIVKISYLNIYTSKVINNGIDTNQFSPKNTDGIRERYNLSGKFIILGVTSIWSRRKGLSDFISLSNYLDENYQIVLVGLNKKQLKDLPINILGIERTENILELAQLYSCADVFINPTWEDNFPTTNLEALACGTPIVTYHTGGSIESVSPETGFVVEQGDIAGLYNAIITVQKKGKNYYSDACLRRAIKMYDKNERYLEYINLYNSMINLNPTTNESSI